MANDRRDATRRDWPTMLGEFRIIRQLAVGPYSTALLVRMIGDPERRGEMVLKVLHPVTGPAWKAAMRMDTTAADLVRSRPHPNLGVYFEKGGILEHCYVLQEFVDGIDLRSLLTLFPQPLGEFPERAKMGIVVQLAAALEHLHSIPTGEDGKGRLIHGDLHPGNVLIDREGNVKLMDVGFADMALPAIRPAVSGSVVGSPGYLAPEQIADRRATPSTDVFAFGSLLAELFTGEPLFRGDTTVAILDRTREAKIDDVVDQIAASHAGAARILRRSVTPERRGRLSDGVLLVGEMFAAAMTDDAREPLAELVQAALAAKDEGIVLPARDLVASDGSLVDVGNLTEGMADSDAALDAPGEPSHESEVPSAELDSLPSMAPSVEEEAAPPPSSDEPPPPPPPVDLEPELEETEVDRPAVVVPPPADEAPAVAAKDAGPPAEPAKPGEPAKTPPPAKKKGGKGLMMVAAVVIVLFVCGGGAVAAAYGFNWFGLRGDPVPDPKSFEDELAEALGGLEVATPAEEATPEEPTPAAEGDELLEGDEEVTGDAETDALAEEEEETPEEPTPEPEPLTEEEKRRLAEEEERRREEREQKRKEREEERKRKEEEEKFKSREEELEAAADDIDWGFAEEADGDEDWLNDDDDDKGDDKIDLDIDALTRSAPDVPPPSAADPPKVKHSPIRSGRYGSTVTLRLTVSPADDYTGVLYYRGSPNGSWNSTNISGGDNGRITARLKLGDWISDDHTKVEYYFLVDGPGGSSGAGTRLSPYSFEIR